MPQRSLIGLLSKPVTLYPIDAAHPLAFLALQDNQKISLVFKRNTAGDINRSHMGIFYGFSTLYKRPQHQSPRFWLTAILGVWIPHPCSLGRTWTAGTDSFVHGVANREETPKINRESGNPAIN